jgi:aryl-phospho-beta-D-glucosidase BglC (GH1 family)
MRLGASTTFWFDGWPKHGKTTAAYAAFQYIWAPNTSECTLSVDTMGWWTNKCQENQKFAIDSLNQELDRRRQNPVCKNKVGVRF